MMSKLSGDIKRKRTARNGQRSNKDIALTKLSEQVEKLSSRFEAFDDTLENLRGVLEDVPNRENMNLNALLDEATDAVVNGEQGDPIAFGALLDAMFWCVAPRGRMLQDWAQGLKSFLLTDADFPEVEKQYVLLFADAIERFRKEMVKLVDAREHTMKGL
jgi:hypothetical protein